MKNLSPILPATQWLKRELRQSSNFIRNCIGPDPELKLDTEIFLKNPLGIASFFNTQLFFPLQELVIARYPNNYFIFRACTNVGVLNRYGLHLTESDQDFIYFPIEKKQSLGNIFYMKETHTDRLVDKRRAMGFSTDLSLPGQYQRAMNFIEFLDWLTPFDSETKEQINQLLDLNNREFTTSPALEKDKHYDPPYFDIPDTNKNARTLFIGGTSRYYDFHLPETMPELHKAVLDNDVKKVKTLVDENPLLVHSNDPLGTPAWKFAKKFGSAGIIIYLIKKRQQIVRYDERTQHNLNFFAERSDENNFDQNDEQLKKYESQYTPLMRDAKTNSDLHAACIVGNLATVRTVLQNNPQRLEEQNAIGYTPLLLAASCGHVDIVSYLLTLNPSIETVKFYHEPTEVTHYYSLIEHANTPEIMEKFLNKSLPLFRYRDRLLEAVEQNDYKMAAVILFYAISLPVNRNGYTAFEFVIQTVSQTHHVELLKLFLQFWTDYVPEGPYSTQMSSEVIALLIAHNKKITNKRASYLERPKIAAINFDDRNQLVITKLGSEALKMVSTIKPIQNLSLIEKKEIFDLYFKYYKKRFDDTVIDRKAYFDDMVSINPNAKRFIDICKIDNTIFGFLTFEIFETIHPETNESIIIFHGMLTVNHAQQNQSFATANLSFRVPLALQKLNPDKKVFVYVKAIPPGFGVTIFPRELKIYPKFALSEKLINHIVNLTGEQLSEDGTIPVKLELLSRTPNSEKAPLSFLWYQFKNTEGVKEKSKALPIAFEMNEEAFESYLKHLENNGVTVDNFNQFTETWQSLENEYLCLRPKL